MKMSIIIPVYNVEKYLDECLATVCRQTLEEIEVICINDCSADSSPVILEKWSKIDDRIVVLDNARNGGLSYTRNVGLRHARGDYVYFIDSDDYLYDDRVLEKGFKYLSNCKLDGLLVDAEVIYEDNYTGDDYNGIRKYQYAGVKNGQEMAAALWANRDIDTPVWRYIWRREFLLANQLQFQEGIIHEDFLFTLKSVLMSHRLMCINEKFYVYRKRKDSITASAAVAETRFYSYLTSYHEILKFVEGRKLIDGADSLVIGWLKTISFNLLLSYLMIRKMREYSREKMFHDTLQKVFLNHAWKERYKYLQDGMDSMQFELLQNTECIIIYGAGKIGAEMLDLLSLYGLREKIKIAVSQGMGNLEGIEVHEITDLKELRRKSVVVVAVSSKYRDAVMAELEILGFESFFVYDSLY